MQREKSGFLFEKQNSVMLDERSDCRDDERASAKVSYSHNNACSNAVGI